MALDGYDRGQFEREFRRELNKARKKAGNKVGRMAVRQRLKSLGSVSERRKAGVRHVVSRRTGMLTVLDHAPLAPMQETGGTIRAKSGKLFVGSAGSKPKAGEKTFAVRDTVFAKARGGKIRIVATLRDSVTIKKLPRTFGDVIDGLQSKYADEIDKNFYDGV